MQVDLVVSRRRFGEQRMAVGLLEWYQHMRPADCPILPPIAVLQELAAEDHVVYDASVVTWTPFEVSQEEYQDFLSAARGQPLRALPSGGYDRGYLDLVYQICAAPDWVTTATTFDIWVEGLLFGVPHEEHLHHERRYLEERKAFELPDGGVILTRDPYPPRKEFRDKWSYWMLKTEPVLAETPAGHEPYTAFGRGDTIEHEILGSGRVEGFVYEHDLLKVVVRYACARRVRFKIPPHIIQLAPPDAEPPAIEPPPAAMRYVRGDATQPRGEGAKIIAHVCNDKGGWGKGFVVALGSRFPGAEASYREAWDYRELNHFGLGKTFMAPVADEIWVAHMIAQHGYRATKAGPPLRYDALRWCLETVREHALDMGASVHMPRIGAGLAGGDWNQIEPIVRETLADAGVEVTVYDWP